MWYEILPSAAVFYGVLLIPGLATIYIHKYVYNGKERRPTSNKYQWSLLQRDKRIFGNGYVCPGLDKID